MKDPTVFLLSLFPIHPLAFSKLNLPKPVLSSCLVPPSGASDGPIYVKSLFLCLTCVDSRRLVPRTFAKLYTFPPVPMRCLGPKHALPSLLPSPPAPALKDCLCSFIPESGTTFARSPLLVVQSCIELGFSLPLKSSQNCFLHKISEHIFPPSLAPCRSCPNTTRH